MDLSSTESAQSLWGPEKRQPWALSWGGGKLGSRSVKGLGVLRLWHGEGMAQGKEAGLGCSPFLPCDQSWLRTTSRRAW